MRRENMTGEIWILPRTAEILRWRSNPKGPNAGADRREIRRVPKSLQKNKGKKKPETSFPSHSCTAVSREPSRNLIAGCFSFFCLLLSGLSTCFLIPLLQDDTRPFLPSFPITGPAALIPTERRPGLLWLLLICSIEISTLPVLDRKSVV